MAFWCEPTVLRGAAVVNPGDAVPVGPRDIAIGPDGRIDALLPPGARVTPAIDVDAHGLVAFPGLIDCHVHLCFDPERHPEDFLVDISDADLRDLVIDNLRETVARGVTTVRDLASRGDTVRRLKADVQRGSVIGPRIQTAGPALTSLQGHCWYAGTVVGNGHLKQAADLQLGYDDEWMKIMVTGGTLTRGSDPDRLQFGAAEVSAAVKRARDAGTPTAVHVLTHEGVDIAVQAGVATIEHGIGMSDAQARAAAAAHQALVPTLVAGGLALEADPQSDDEDVAQVRAQQAEHWRSVRLAVERGVTVLAGSDAGCPHVPHGSLLAEIELLERTGLDRRQALLAGTASAAEALGLSRVGRIEPGWAADLLLLASDPVSDLAALARPVAVYARGRRVDGVN